MSLISPVEWGCLQFLNGIEHAMTDFWEVAVCNCRLVGKALSHLKIQNLQGNGRISPQSQLQKGSHLIVDLCIASSTPWAFCHLLGIIFSHCLGDDVTGWWPFYAKDVSHGNKILICSMSSNQSELVGNRNSASLSHWVRYRSWMWRYRWWMTIQKSNTS